MRLLNIPPWYFSRWNSLSNNINRLVRIHWGILSYCLLFPLFLLIYIILTIINTCWAWLFNLHVSRINPGTFSAALQSSYSGVSGSLMRLLSTLSDSLSASHLSLLSFGLFKAHSSQADLWFPKCIEVHDPQHFPRENGRIISFGRHSALEFVPQGGALQTELVAQVIIQTIQMQPPHQVECLTGTPWQCPQYLNGILWLSFASFERGIASV